MTDSKYRENFFHTNQLIYKLSGIFLFDRENVPVFRKCLEMIWCFAIYGPCTYYIFLELWILRETIHDIKRFLNQTGIFLTHLLGIAKVALLVFQHERLLKLEYSLQNKDYHYEAHGAYNPEELLEEAKLFSSRTSLSLYCLYSFVGGSAFIATEITIQRNIKEEILSDDITCYDFMQYYFHIPWNSDTKTNCRLTNVFMSYCITGYAFGIACHDGLYAALLNCLKTQLNILNGAITTIRPRIYDRLNVSEDSEIFSDRLFPELESQLYEEFKNINKHLIELLRVSDELEDIFSFMILGQTTSSIFIMASCLFYATNIPLTSPVFFSQAEYFTCIFIQLSVFCWFGSGVTDASEEINNYLYDCNWYSASNRFTSSLITTMCRMQKPIRLTIGKFSPLTLRAIVTVTKASVSYYAVFKSVGN